MKFLPFSGACRSASTLKIKAYNRSLAAFLRTCVGNILIQAQPAAPSTLEGED